MAMLNYRWYKIPFFYKWLYPNGLYRVPTNKKEIFITFDDGPVPELTQFVLQELQKHEAKATFFCVGDNITKYPSIFESIISQNHTIGNHTYNHLNGFEHDNNTYFENIKKCDDIINLNHRESNKYWYRPPYGKITFNQMKYLEKIYKIVFWDVISYDFDKLLSPEMCLKNVIKNTTNGSIVVFHDNIKAKKNLEYVLPRYLEYYTSKGYTFKAL